MRNSAACLLLTVLLGGCASGGFVNQVDALMRDYEGDVPGASVLVIRDGKAVVRRSYGLAKSRSTPGPRRRRTTASRR